MREFHSLAGIGGTYGFHEISRIAREGELLIRKTILAARPVDDTEAAVLRKVMSELETARLKATT
jgi:chemotaxis protein histidine kinase CheA